MREANNLGWKPQFSGHNALGDPQTFQLAGPLAEGAISDRGDGAAGFRQARRQGFHRRAAEVQAEHQADHLQHARLPAGKLLAEALKRSGGKADEASIVSALESMKNYDTGLMAPLTFAADRPCGLDGGGRS